MKYLRGEGTNDNWFKENLIKRILQRNLETHLRLIEDVSTFLGFIICTWIKRNFDEMTDRDHEVKTGEIFV